MVAAVTREKLVLDLSCRLKDGKYYVVTDKWQNFTEVEVNKETLDKLSGTCPFDAASQAVHRSGFHRRVVISSM